AADGDVSGNHLTASRILLGARERADNTRLLLAPEVETVRLQRLLDLLDRLLAEVRDRRALRLGLRDEVADRLDPDPLEAVVRPDAELELLDREVLHPVRERDLGCADLADTDVGERLDPVDVGEDRELADEDLGSFRDRVLRADGAVGRDVEPELVVVRPLADAGSLDVVGDAPDRREDR